MKYNRIDITIHLEIISSLLTSHARFFFAFFGCLFITTLFHAVVYFFPFHLKVFIKQNHTVYL